MDSQILQDKDVNDHDKGGVDEDVHAGTVATDIDKGNVATSDTSNVHSSQVIWRLLSLCIVLEFGCIHCAFWTWVSHCPD